MGSLSSNRVPVINFSVKDMKPGTSSWGAVRAGVRQALEEFGCFEAVFGEPQVHRDMLDAMEQLFDLPLETRLKHPSNDRNKGKPDPQIPLWANMGISDVQDLKTLQSFTNLMWPEGNSKFCESVYSYVNEGTTIEKMVKRMVFESFGVEGYFDSLAELTTYWIRLNRYRAPKTDETKLGLKVHTDTSFISVLSQNDVHGLEIQAKDGQWIGVTPAHSSFVVLGGDALLAWSNGRLHAPPHRVIMNADHMRYSIALFAFVKGVIQTPEELVDEEHPLLFKAFDHFGYRQFITTEEGQKVASPIKAYCGI